MFASGRRLIFALLTLIPGSATAQVHAAVVHGDSGTVAVWNHGDSTLVYVVGPRGNAVMPRVTDSVLGAVGISPDNAKALRDPPALTYSLVDTHVDYQVDRPAKEISDSANPAYPDPLRADTVAGKATVLCVIDSTGRPVIGSFKALDSGNPLFTLAIFSRLPDLRFEPAQVKGHPVSELVRMQFAFGRRSRPVTVGAPQGSVEVSLDRDTARLVLKTATGTFGVHADSLTMAAWADRAAGARPPVPHGEKKSDYAEITISYPEPSLNTTVAMGIMRLKADSASPYQITGSNGSWVGSLVLPYDSAQRLFAAMHQSTSTMSVWREGTPVFQWTGPYFDFQVERQAMPMPSNVSPGYPEVLRARRVEGQAVFQFIVDTTGVIDLSSVRVLKSSHPLFALAVYQRLPAMRFIPAQISGRRVQEMVQQPYSFSLTR